MQHSVFIVDSTFLFVTAHRVLYEVPALVVGNRDNTELFGIIKYFLRIRNTFGTNRYALAVGEEAYAETEAPAVQRAVSLFKRLGVPVLHRRHSRMVDICDALPTGSYCLVTQSEILLSLATEAREVVLFDGKGNYKTFDRDIVISRYGLAPESIPDMLALTTGLKPKSFTKRQALSIIQRYGNIRELIQDPTQVASEQVRRKLENEKTFFLQQLDRFKPVTRRTRLRIPKLDPNHGLNTTSNREVLRNHGFHSLLRMLPSTKKAKAIVPVSTDPDVNYHAVKSAEDLNALVKNVQGSRICSVDTETSSTDPQTAQLFGISFSTRKGEAYYLPLVEEDLGDISVDTALSTVTDILSGSVGVVGHNLKYDYVVLRRHGVTIRNVHFDTMLAVHECHGDWDQLNLPAVAKKLLGKHITGYRDIVAKHKTILDIPFTELLTHACTDADVTLQLYYVLKKELAKRRVLAQYNNNTLSHMAQLADWECTGIIVNTEKLTELRRTLHLETDNARKAIKASSGTSFNPDSEADLTKVLGADDTLCSLLGSRRVTSRVLEELAISSNLVRLVVQYRRKQKKLRVLEEIMRSCKSGRIYPIFKQTSNCYGRLVAAKPRLFECTDVSLESCFPKQLSKSYPSAKQALERMSIHSKDRLLAQDLKLPSWPMYTQDAYGVPSDVDREKLLLHTLIGYTNATLQREFLLSQSVVASIRHDIMVRYSKSVGWVTAFRERALRQGYVSANRKRRWIAGLQSANLQKREKALEAAVRWVLEY
ncbi:MAG: hypothetical protein ISS70_07450 [Phycisphaerae bacterium]|nr:hypothetical protein [Phycisphaerae bacterium]